MKIQKMGNNTKIWLSSLDTWRWANRTGRKWPCSTLADNRIYIEMAPNKDILDVRVNGRQPKDLDSHELRCCLNDLVGEK